MKQQYPEVTRHPCFHRAASHWFTCLDIPVARRCNIKCNYCNRVYDCPNDNANGVASKVLTPAQVIKRLRKAVASDSRLTVIGISGPGEPLANTETFDTLKLVNKEYPHLIKCLSTNGLLLPDRMEELVEAGVDTLKVTVNAVDSETASFVYSWIHYKGEEYTNTDAASILVRNQLEGIRLAVERGIIVQVNFVLIPGINENMVSSVAWAAKSAGAKSMRIIPLLPHAELAFFKEPDTLQLLRARASCSAIIRQMEECTYCRGTAK